MVNTSTGAVGMDIYEDSTVECTQLWVEPMLGVSANNPTTKICMTSRNNAIAIPSALVPDVTFACTGGMVNTADIWQILLFQLERSLSTAV